MQLRINGEQLQLDDGTTLEALVLQRGLRLDRVATELNGVIVPKAAYADTVLHEGDVVELVSFVGGG